MKNQLIEVACRRRKLLREIEAQRIEVAEISRQWHKPITLVDVGLKAVRFICDHPALSSAAAAAFMAVSRKSIAGLFQKREFLLHHVPFFGSRITK
jgi:hypothetical protein